jgi:hypothetical protein
MEKRNEADFRGKICAFIGKFKELANADWKPG